MGRFDDQPCLTSEDDTKKWQEKFRSMGLRFLFFYFILFRLKNRSLRSMNGGLFLIFSVASVRKILVRYQKWILGQPGNGLYHLHVSR